MTIDELIKQLEGFKSTFGGHREVLVFGPVDPYGWRAPDVKFAPHTEANGHRGIPVGGAVVLK